MTCEMGTRESRELCGWEGVADFYSMKGESETFNTIDIGDVDLCMSWQAECQPPSGQACASCLSAGNILYLSGALPYGPHATLHCRSDAVSSGISLQSLDPCHVLGTSGYSRYLSPRLPLNRHCSSSPFPVELALLSLFCSSSSNGAEASPICAWRNVVQP